MGKFFIFVSVRIPNFTITHINLILMKNRFSILLLLALFSGISFQVNAQAKQSKKKRIAVFYFDDKTDNGRGWYGQRSVGHGMSDMVVTELVKTGKFIVIERNELDALLKEQDLGASGVVTPESAAKIGQVLGVEVAVLGGVTEFGYNKNNTGVRVSGVGVGVGKQAAVVALDIRLVNTSTGQIDLAESIRRQKSAPSLNVNTRRVDFKNENDFNQSVVGKATREAVEDVIDLISRRAESIPWSAKVVTEKDNQVYINSGKNHGVEPGEEFVVYRPGEELIDPDTGLSLGSMDTKVGKIKVIDNMVGEGKASICQIVEKYGSGFQRGDVVKEN
jgi:curli biogenesis system outer membrane secretion channel CsgG